MNNNIEKTTSSLSEKSLNPEKQDKVKAVMGKKPQQLTKNLIIKMVWCLSLSLFWVIFAWGVWSHGVYAFGMNIFVFWFFYYTSVCLGTIL